MAQQHPARPPPPPAGKGDSKKRKEHPSNPKSDSHKRAKVDHRAKQRDARALATQTSSKAFKNGELDVDKFVKAREYEIRALEDGMSRSKKALTQRAFQQVPKELRRRTASHNAKRVPKRLQKRAKREMIEDNTPTVTARRRKPTRHMRLRLETAKKLRALGAMRKLPKTGDPDVLQKATSRGTNPVFSRPAKVKKASLARPPVVKAKFRKRQMNKTWLPTHMFHAKRARMTPPKEPLWRFAIPLTPTAKSYRPTHRAANEKGAIAWDTSYMTTIGLTGQQRSIEGVLKALSVDLLAGSNDSKTSSKWIAGSRIWEGFLFQRESPHLPIASATIIWCAAPNVLSTDRERNQDTGSMRRSILIRCHPAAFFQVWEELLRLCKVAKPQVTLEDLRFEIGSIELTGTGATESLHGALWPSTPIDNAARLADAAVRTWLTLKSLSSQAMLPKNVSLGFEVQDPRLHFPPRTVKVVEQSATQDDLMELLTKWPLDQQQTTQTLFNRRARHLASSRLPSQKAINRRKSLAAPGEYPAASERDPSIPVLLFNTMSRDKRQATWTVLMPWKCVQPVWYSIMYYPLSTGGQPRFGGLDEKRQLAFEVGQPWFPGDFPGTQAGWDWETDQQKKREDDWRRRPKSKRVNWETVRTGENQKGEIGLGWACDWNRLLAGLTKSGSDDVDAGAEKTVPGDAQASSKTGPASSSKTCPPPVVHTTAEQANSLLKNPATEWIPNNALATIRLKLLNRGVPQTCARIYRLPSETTTTSRLRKRWLDLHPRATAARKQNTPKNTLPRIEKDAPPHIVRQRLAASLLEPPKVGDDKYPPCPGGEDLIGFVTTGNYNLGEGQGTGIGSILLCRVKDGVMTDAVEGKLCVVRNAGDSIGRLASWEIV